MRPLAGHVRKPLRCCIPGVSRGGFGLPGANSLRASRVEQLWATQRDSWAFKAASLQMHVWFVVEEHAESGTNWAAHRSCHLRQTSVHTRSKSRMGGTKLTPHSGMSVVVAAMHKLPCSAARATARSVCNLIPVHGRKRNKKRVCAIWSEATLAWLLSEGRTGCSEERLKDVAGFLLSTNGQSNEGTTSTGDDCRTQT